MIYTVYNLATGEIGATISLPDGAPQFKNWDSRTEGVYYGAASSMDFYMGKKGPVPKPPRPSKQHTFNWDTKVWEIVRTLEQHKQAKLEELRVKKNIKGLDTVRFKQWSFSLVEPYRTKLLQFIMLSKTAIANNVPFSTYVHTTDGEDVELTAQDFVGIELALITNISDTTISLRPLKKAIKDSKDLLELSEINLES
jgi:hypothetical protein